MKTKVSLSRSNQRSVVANIDRVTAVSSSSPPAPLKGISNNSREQWNFLFLFREILPFSMTMIMAGRRHHYQKASETILSRKRSGRQMYSILHTKTIDVASAKRRNQRVNHCSHESIVDG